MTEPVHEKRPEPQPAVVAPAASEPARAGKAVDGAAPHVPLSKLDAMYQALGGSSTVVQGNRRLKAVAAIAQRTLTTLELDNLEIVARDHVVQRAMSEIEQQLQSLYSFASGMTPDERASLRDEADAAGDAMRELRGWIENRTATRNVQTRFVATQTLLDVVLIGAGVEIVGRRKGHGLKADESTEAAAELARLRGAQTRLEAALGQQHGAILDGLTRFQELAKLTDPDPPSWVAEIAQAVLVAVLGHVFGGLAGAGLGKLATGGAAVFRKQIAKEVIEKGTDVTVDAVQGVLGVAGQALSSDDSNRNARARIYFRESFSRAADATLRRARLGIENDIEFSRVSAEMVDDRAAKVEATLGTISDQTYQTVAAGWAQYLAQSALGTHRGKTDTYGRQISRMNEFLGSSNSQGDRQYRTGHVGADGVVQLLVEMDPESNGDDVFRPGKLRIPGLNWDLTQAILDGADHTFGRIWLPKTIHIESANGYRRAVIAIDERNTVCDVTGWDGLSSLGLARARVPSVSSLVSRLVGMKV